MAARHYLKGTLPEHPPGRLHSPLENTKIRPRKLQK